MKVHCPGCNKEFDISGTIPEKVHGNIVCDRCNTQFKVYKELHENKVVSIVLNKKDKGPFPRCHPKRSVKIRPMPTLSEIKITPIPEVKPRSFFQKYWSALINLPTRMRRFVCRLICKE